MSLPPTDFPSHTGGRMTVPRLPLFAVAVLLAAPAARGTAGDSADWPRFRGPNGQGVAPDGAKPPSQFGPEKNLLWKADLPPGHSSPVVTAGRTFLTAFDGQKLETICLDATTGAIFWRRAAPAEKIEKVNRSNSPAASTPATNGRRVYAYFGSFGLLAYDLDGRELWKVP